MPDKPKSLAKDIVVKMFPRPRPRPADKAGPRIYVSSVQVVRSRREPTAGQTAKVQQADDTLVVTKPKPKAKKAAKKTTARKPASKKAAAKKPAAKKAAKAKKS